MTVAIACRSGFCSYYFRVGMKPVLVQFNVDAIVRAFCPGVQKVLESEMFAHVDHGSASDIFISLRPLDRLNTNLDINSLPREQNQQTNGATLSATNQTASKSSLKSANGKLPTTSSKTQRGSQSNVLTAEKLNDLQKTFMPFKAPPAVAPLSQNVTKKLLYPQEIFEESARLSQNDRPKRMNSVLARMRNLNSN